MCDSGTLHHSFRSALRSHCPCLWCVAAAISLFAMHLIMAQFEYRLHTRPTSSLVQSFSSRSCGAAVALNPDGCTHIQRGDDHHLIHSLHLHFYGLWFRSKVFRISGSKWAGWFTQKVGVLRGDCGGVATTEPGPLNLHFTSTAVWTN